uniref:Secreted protein n=1 Tax=Haemonchus placei TaxID=6290 RepID=A0A0N4VZP4_HAEPC
LQTLLICCLRAPTSVDFGRNGSTASFALPARCTIACSMRFPTTSILGNLSAFGT